MLDYAAEERPGQVLDDTATRGERSKPVHGAQLLLDEDDVPKPRSTTSLATMRKRNFGPSDGVLVVF